jgi:hypothetical protein
MDSNLLLVSIHHRSRANMVVTSNQANIRLHNSKATISRRRRKDMANLLRRNLMVNLRLSLTAPRHMVDLHHKVSTEHHLPSNMALLHPTEHHRLSSTMCHRHRRH